MNADTATLDPKAVAAYTSSAKHLGMVEFITNIIPTTVVDAFGKGEILLGGLPRRSPPTPCRSR